METPSSKAGAVCGCGGPMVTRASKTKGCTCCSCTAGTASTPLGAAGSLHSAPRTPTSSFPPTSCSVSVSVGGAMQCSPSTNYPSMMLPLRPRHRALRMRRRQPHLARRRKRLRALINARASAHKSLRAAAAAAGRSVPARYAAAVCCCLERAAGVLRACGVRVEPRPDHCMSETRVSKPQFGYVYVRS